MPRFFPLGKKHVLLYSTAGGVIWESGEFEPKELKFHSERRGILDHGAYYAQKTQLDAHGNRILWGWIPEKRPDADLIAAGWASCMALPRALSLSPEGELEMTVAPEALSLREKAYSLSSKNSAKDSEILQYISIEDLRAELAWKASPNNFALILEDHSGPWWSVSLAQSNSALTLTVNGTATKISDQPGTHNFHLFLDASVAELIVDRRHAITTRTYRKPDGPLRIRIGNDSQLETFEGWQLQPISPDRLTS